MGRHVAIDTRIIGELRGFDADQGVVSRVVGAMALSLKQQARKEQERTFTQRTGKYRRSIWYRQRRGQPRAVLYAGNLSSIYEHRGALIQPMKGLALRFEINGKEIFYRGVIKVEARPWFDIAIRRARAREIDVKAASGQMEKEFRRHNLGN